MFKQKCSQADRERERGGGERERIKHWQGKRGGRRCRVEAARAPLAGAEALWPLAPPLKNNSMNTAKQTKKKYTVREGGGESKQQKLAGLFRMRK